MNKSVLISIKPYYVFLIIAHKMGWDIPQEKTIEVRKDYPKDKEWNRVVYIYCSKDIKSFNLIPAQYQPVMKTFLGKVIGEFVCDKVTEYIAYKTQKGSKLCKNPFFYACLPIQEMCLTIEQVEDYGKGETLYAWHISDLKIYDKPKELREFKRWNRTEENAPCTHTKWLYPDCKDCKACNLIRPPQSWCYVESLGE